MKLGMYTAELSRPGPEALFKAVRDYGFEEVQFDFRSVGEEELPIRIGPALTDRIRSAADRNGIKIGAVNGTFNMIDPDIARRKDGILRFGQIAAACGGLGCPLITLCAGSRNPDHKWSWHDGNLEPGAWADLLESAYRLAEVAERHDVYLGLEPEASSVVNTAERARRLLDTVRSPRLKIIMDPANLFQPGEADPANARAVLDRAFGLLGGDIICAHGKDIRAGPGLSFTPAGRGIVDFAYFLELLRRSRYDGAIILHGMKRESEFADSVSFMRRLATAG